MASVVLLLLKPIGALGKIRNPVKLLVERADVDPEDAGETFSEAVAEAFQLSETPTFSFKLQDPLQGGFVTPGPDVDLEETTDMTSNVPYPPRQVAGVLYAELGSSQSALAPGFEAYFKRVDMNTGLTLYVQLKGELTQDVQKVLSFLSMQKVLSFLSMLFRRKYLDWSTNLRGIC